MISKDKIKEINSRRKPSKGLSERDITESSTRALKSIHKNDAIAMFDVLSIYSNYQLTSSIEVESCIFNSTYSRKVPFFRE